MTESVYSSLRTTRLSPPAINRGVEIANEVADGQQAVILDQVTNGIAIRMAVMAMTLSTQQDAHS